MRRANQLKIALSATALAWIVIISLWNTSIGPGYFMRNFVAALWSDMQSPQLTVNVLSNVPGMKPWLAQITLITGIPLAEIHTLPFGAAIRALLYAAIVHRITTRPDLAAGAALVTLLYPWAGWGYNSMFVHSLGGFLFLSIILLLVIVTDGTHNARHSILGISFILGLFLFDYTASAWTGIMLVALLGVAHYRPSLRLTGVGILTALAAIFYSPKTTVVSYATMLQDVQPANVLLDYFGSDPVTRSSPYEYVPEGTGLGLALYVYLLIVLALLAYGLLLGYSMYRERSVRAVFAQTSTREYVIGAAMVGGGVVTLLYTFMGRFTQFFIFVMGPLLGILAVWYASQRLPPLQKRRVAISAVFIVLLLGFIGVEFAYQMQTGEISRYADTDGETTGTWLAAHSESPTVKTDLMTSGRMRMAEEQHDGNFNWTWHDEDSYAAVVEGNDPKAEYTVIDMESEAGVRAIGGSWTRFKSFGPYEEQINRNTHMSRVYSDGSQTVYV